MWGIDILEWRICYYSMQNFVLKSFSNVLVALVHKMLVPLYTWYCHFDFLSFMTTKSKNSWKCLQIYIYMYYNRFILEYYTEHCMLPFCRPPGIKMFLWTWIYVELYSNSMRAIMAPLLRQRELLEQYQWLVNNHGS